MSSTSWGQPRLWQRAGSGDAEAFAELVRTMLPLVRRFLYRLQGFRGDVDDATQEVFLRLMDALPRLSDPAKARSFVLGIAANVFHEAVRARRVEELPDLPSKDEDPVQGAVEEELRVHLEQALQGLPPSLRTVLVLSVYEGCSPREIAETLELSPEAVRHRLFRARAILREKLPGTLAEARW